MAASTSTDKMKTLLFHALKKQINIVHVTTHFISSQFTVADEQLRFIVYCTRFG